MEQLDLFQEVFPANPSPQQVKDEEQKMIGSSGLRCYELYQKYVPDGLLRKMSRALLASTRAWYSKECSLTWKVKGIRSNRLLFQLVPSVRRTGETGYGLLPTMEANERNASPRWTKTRAKGQSLEPNLAGKIQMLPTPHNNCYTGPGSSGRQGGENLQTTVSMLATPQARDYMPAHTLEYIQKKKAQGYGMRNLNDEISLLPTPAARDYKGANSKAHMKKARPHMDHQLPNAVTHGTNHGLKLHPDFVLWMMGFPLNWLDVK